MHIPRAVLLVLAALAASPMRAGYDAGKTPPGALRTLLRGLNRERRQ